MSKRRKPAVERYHDRVAPRYDDSYDDAYWRWHDALTWDHIKPHLPTNLRAPVLDLGCGTGKWAMRLSRSGYTVACVDISQSMLEQARRKLSETGDERASFHRADLVDMSGLPAGHFALALALGDPIGCAESPARALKEIRRLLTPDGKLIATFDNRLNAIEFYLQTADTEQLTEFLRTGRTNWLTRDRDERFEIATYTPAQVRKLLESAGFEIVDMIGKTVLPMRHHRPLLEDAAAARTWMKIEKSLCRDEAAMGRAAHLQVVASPGG
ncbi:MAG: methyltransferase domain-containing protein [Phycisphaerales bacterium]|nr:methyltransferase domain-containing protein [Phycisphaerales bacterium]